MRLDGEPARSSRPDHIPSVARGIGTVRLKDHLGQVQPDCANFRHERLVQVLIDVSILAHQGREGASTPSGLID
jgi:hypothetical protein